MSKLIFLFLSLLFTLCGKTQGDFTFTADLKEVYQMATDLRLKPAREKLAIIRTSDPNNKLVYFIENYVDFFEVFIQEEKEVFDLLEANKDIRISKIREGNENSPYYLFCEAEINIQWAIARLKFNDKLKAAAEIYRAYALLEENKKRFPDFSYNNKSLSFIHVMAQSLPGILRKILDIEGSIEKGTEEIRTLYNVTKNEEEALFKDEIAIIYAYILFYQNNKKQEAWEILEKEYLDGNISSPIIQFVVANMAQKTGKTDMAISLLQQGSRFRDAIPFYYLNFLLGKWKLYRLDDDADEKIITFLSQFQGEHYIKEAYQKLAWYHLVVKEDLAGYKRYIGEIPKNGKKLVDEDAQAEEEAKAGEIPNPDLLKARLLFDGGYYQRAHDFLVKKAHVFSGKRDILEYNYRMGRISQSLKNYPEALEYYFLTLRSTDKKSYYLCNAALQSALILEEQEKYANSLEYIDVCLELNPKRYKNSLHQKAKSARERIKSKSGL